ncbi:MAG: hotdog fold thioesterase [Saprospiraceae bacterium]|nr:hotdog fold thioesterase [Bacteroidia bacterium]NNK90360.1 hotdog fold thioesterase [Saprospiraceae bacterium]
MIWKNNPTVEGLNTFRTNTLVEHLDIRFTEIGENYLVATMPVDKRTVQPMGLLHGGASVALAETIGSVASLLQLDDVVRYGVVGIEINANHLKSARSGLVSGKVTPVRIGRRMHVWNIEIRNEQDELICVSRLTTMIKENKV